MSINDPDHELMLRIALKDMPAYRELVDKHLNNCVRVAERMLGNRQDAEDISQEVCLRIWKEANRWKPKAKFSTWLYRVTINACLDHKRKAAKYTTSDDLDAIADERQAVDDRMMQEQYSREIKTALMTLPKRQRAAVILSYYEELSNRDAADSLGMKLGAFQQLLFRAKQNLKDELHDHFTEHNHGRKAG